MTDTLNTVSKERFAEEFKKLFLKSPKPSVGLQLAWDLGLFDKTFPEFRHMADTLQSPDWHPEGDVWTHTKMVVDALSELLSDSDLEDGQRFTLFLAVLCHDLGKPEVTWYDNPVLKVVKDGGFKSGEKVFVGGWDTFARGHEEAGLAPTKTFLEKLNVDQATTAKVLKLVEYHLKPVTLYKDKAGKGAVKRLARNLHPATLSELLWVAKADQAGRGTPVEKVDFSFAGWLESQATDLDVLEEKPAPVVNGKDLLKLGYSSGSRLGKVLKKLTELHEEFELNKEELLDYAHFIMDKPEVV